MAKIFKLENARNSSRLWYVWLEGKTYMAKNMSGRSKAEAIASLPTPTPNFIQQVAKSKDEAIELAKSQAAETLLASPL